MQKKIDAEYLSLERVKPEYRNKRSLLFNLRHRCYGINVPATDIDFLEYNNGEPCAIIDHKETDSWEWFYKNSGRGSLNVQKKVANRLKVPFFVVRCDYEFKEFKITPMNSFAKKFFIAAVYVSEKTYVEFLYKIRNNEINYELTNRGMFAINKKYNELLNSLDK